MFTRLLDFQREHGHSRVRGCDHSLSTWVTVQRLGAREGWLKPERRQRLALADFDFRILDPWQEQLAALKGYQSQHGNTAVDVLIDPELAEWCAEQRRLWQERRLDAKLIKKLSTLGFEWEPEEEEESEQEAVTTTPVVAENLFDGSSMTPVAAAVTNETTESSETVAETTEIKVAVKTDAPKAKRSTQSKPSATTTKPDVSSTAKRRRSSPTVYSDDWALDRDRYTSESGSESKWKASEKPKSMAAPVEKARAKKESPPVKAVKRSSSPKPASSTAPRSMSLDSGDRPRRARNPATVYSDDWVLDRYRYAEQASAESTKVAKEAAKKTPPKAPLVRRLSSQGSEASSSRQSTQSRSHRARVPPPVYSDDWVLDRDRYAAQKNNSLTKKTTQGAKQPKAPAAATSESKPRATPVAPKATPKPAKSTPQSSDRPSSRSHRQRSSPAVYSDDWVLDRYKYASDSDAHESKVTLSRKGLSATKTKHNDSEDERTEAKLAPKEAKPKSSASVKSNGSVESGSGVNGSAKAAAARSKVDGVTVGSRVSVFWDDEGKFYIGTVLKKMERRHPFFIKYDDGDSEWANLEERRWRLVRKGSIHDAKEASNGDHAKGSAEEESTVASGKRRWKLSNGASAGSGDQKEAPIATDSAAESKPKGRSASKAMESSCKGAGNDDEKDGETTEPTVGDTSSANGDAATEAAAATRGTNAEEALSPLGKQSSTVRENGSLESSQAKRKRCKSPVSVDEGLPLPKATYAKPPSDASEKDNAPSSAARRRVKRGRNETASWPPGDAGRAARKRATPDRYVDKSLLKIDSSDDATQRDDTPPARGRVTRLQVAETPLHKKKKVMLDLGASGSHSEGSANRAKRAQDSSSTPRSDVKKKGASPKLAKLESDPLKVVIGSRLSVQRPDKKSGWYEGSVIAKRGKAFQMDYDDGDEEWFHREHRQWRLLPPKSQDGAGSANLDRVDVGSRVAVLWEGENEYFNATVTRKRDQKRAFFLEYDDGDEEWLDLNQHQWRLVPGRRKNK